MKGFSRIRTITKTKMISKAQSLVDKHVVRTLMIAPDMVESEVALLVPQQKTFSLIYIGTSGLYKLVVYGGFTVKEEPKT